MKGFLMVTGFGVNQLDITSAFPVFGNVESFTILEESHPAAGDGCAMIVYENRCHAEIALSTMNGLKTVGGQMTVQWSLGDPEQSSFIIVQNLVPIESREQMESKLVTAFQHHGTVLSVEFPAWTHGCKYDVTLVQMADKCEVRRAIEALHGRVLPGTSLAAGLFVMDASAYFCALSVHSPYIVYDAPPKCFGGCITPPSRVSVCKYVWACRRCALKYKLCPICHTEFRLGIPPAVPPPRLFLRVKRKQDPSGYVED